VGVFVVFGCEVDVVIIVEGVEIELEVWVARVLGI